MPTANQLVRKGRKRGKKGGKNTLALGGKPQASGVVLRTFIVTPVKPNSGERKCCRVRLSNGNEITALIPGEGHRVQEHSKVLVEGGNSPDLRHVKYRIVRGVLDGRGVEGRKQRRSKYGTKRAKPE